VFLLRDTLKKPGFHNIFTGVYAETIPARLYLLSLWMDRQFQFISVHLR